MIFANHAHILPKMINSVGTVESLKRYMDEAGIDKCVAFATYRSDIRRIGFDYDTNKCLYDEIKGNPDIIGFGTIDVDNNIEDQIDNIVQLGFKGIKLHPQAQGLKINGERAFKIYGKAQENGLFISFHSGIHWSRLMENRVELFDEVAYNFPNLSFSLEHIGGYSYFTEALGVMVNNIRDIENPRIFAGWTSIADDYGMWSLSNDQLYALLHQTGPYSHLFGIDFPYNNAKYTQIAIQRIKELDIAENTKDLILGGNLARILNMDKKERKK